MARLRSPPTKVMEKSDKRFRSNTEINNMKGYDDES